MRILKLAGYLIIFAFLCVCVGSAEQATGTKSPSGFIWNGTWSTSNYTAYINQNESGIFGGYVPKDLNVLDPGRLEGNVSDDGKTVSGVWIESGSNTYVMSDNYVTFTIDGFADPYGPMSGPVNYTSNATRIGDFLDTNNPWTGNWTTWKKSYHLWQRGRSVTGVNEPLTNVNDETGILEGVISEDGKTYIGRWTEKGGFTFKMSDTGSAFNATITKSLDPGAVVEHMIFSK
ncbi:MAG TPA: hypothetical protein VN372_05980 [Methanospirillum sp.]|nr:hypothetical protein [Methanospirillum sp.]